jgi:hypothetical protein
MILGHKHSFYANKLMKSLKNEVSSELSVYYILVETPSLINF